MVTFLSLVGIICWLIGMASCVMTKSPLAEIGGMILFLIGTVFVCTGAIIEALQKLTRPKPTGAAIPVLKDQAPKA